MKKALPKSRGLRGLARKLAASPKARERLANIRRIQNARETLRNATPKDKVTIDLQNERVVSGRFRGIADGAVFVEKRGGEITALPIRAIKKVGVKKGAYFW